MRLVGTFNFDMNTALNYYSEDNKNFFLDEGKKNKMGSDDLNEWAVWINSPRSEMYEKYIIKRKFMQKSGDEPEWNCHYSILGFNEVMASVIGYGETAEKALKDCKKLFDYLQEQFNIGNC